MIVNRSRATAVLDDSSVSGESGFATLVGAAAAAAVADSAAALAMASAASEVVGTAVAVAVAAMADAVVAGPTAERNHAQDPRHAISAPAMEIALSVP